MNFLIRKFTQGKWLPRYRSSTSWIEQNVVYPLLCVRYIKSFASLSVIEMDFLTTNDINTSFKSLNLRKAIWKSQHCAGKYIYLYLWTNPLLCVSIDTKSYSQTFKLHFKNVFWISSNMLNRYVCFKLVWLCHSRNLSEILPFSIASIVSCKIQINDQIRFWSVKYRSVFCLINLRSYWSAVL